MPHTCFAPHGYYRICNEGSIIRIRARGPWNLEAIAQYRADMQLQIDAQNGAPWALLGSLSGEAFLLPEAAALLREGIEQDQDRGRVATAYVLEQVALSDLVMELFHRVFDGLEHPVRFFPTIEEAKTWLDEHLSSAKSIQASL